MTQKIQRSLSRITDNTNKNYIQNDIKNKTVNDENYKNNVNDFDYVTDEDDYPTINYDNSIFQVFNFFPLNISDSYYPGNQRPENDVKRNIP